MFLKKIIRWSKDVAYANNTENGCKLLHSQGLHSLDQWYSLTLVIVITTSFISGKERKSSERESVTRLPTPALLEAHGFATRRS